MSVASAVACLVAVLGVLDRACSAAYPLSRYGRSLAWAPLPLYYQRATRPLYYPDSDYYYPQPQAEYVYPLPGYYMDQQRPYYYSYTDEVPDPMGDSQEEMQQDDGLRGEYGQETWYQDTSEDSNARFLEDLILNQMYDGKLPQESSTERQIPTGERQYPTGERQYPSGERQFPSGERQFPSGERQFPAGERQYLTGERQFPTGERQRWVYGEQVKSVRPKPKAPSSKEDEDVRELKSLVRGPDRRDKQKMRKEIVDPFDAQMRPKSNNWDVYRSNNKRSEEGSQKPKTLTTTPPPALARGQKEVVAPRPAVTRTHEPSVYDTIKKLLHMEDLAQGSAPRLQKRSFVDNEDSLVGQLGRLKEMS